MLTLPTDAHTTTSDMRQMAKGNDAYRADRVTAAAATTETVNQRSLYLPEFPTAFMANSCRNENT